MPKNDADNRQPSASDERRIAALEEKLKDAGGLSESAIPTPEQSRKSALMRKIRSQGY